MRRILFRCDAGPIPLIGTGHLSRCLLLAAMVRDRGCEVSFCGRYDGAARGRLEAAGVAYAAPAGNESDVQLLESAIVARRPDVLVHDRLESTRDVIAAARELVPVIVTLDDLGSGAELADVVVNAIVGEGSEPYDNLAFLVVPPPNGVSTSLQRRPRVVLTFGGYDHGSIGQDVAEAVCGADAEIIWLVGGSGDAIRPPEGVTALIDVPNFSELLGTADAAVVAGGLTLFEALANGVPVIAVPQYEHQRRTIQRLARSGVLVAAGDDARGIGEHVRDELDALLADPAARDRLRRRARETVDGLGLQRVAELCLVVERLRWDSDFFGMPIARIYPRRLNQRLLRFALAEFDRLGIACAYYLADSNDAESVRLAESAGFHFVDMRMTFERPLLGLADAFDGVREASAGDIPALEAIAARAYVHSRYFFDRRFEPADCERFYSDWVRKCVTGDLSARVFVVDDASGPVGYIALNHLSAASSSIILVGVADHAQGQGIGRRLVARGLRWAADEGRTRMEVVTQGRNHPAQRLYQQCGFVTARTELWYHWWSQD